MFRPTPDAILIEDLEFQFKGTHFAGAQDQLSGKFKKNFNARIPNALTIVKQDGSTAPLVFETKVEMALYLQSIGWPVKVRAKKEEARIAMANSGSNNFEQRVAFFESNGMLNDDELDFYIEVQLVFDDPNPKYPAPMVYLADPQTMQMKPMSELAVATLDNAAIVKFDALIYTKYWSNLGRSGYTARLSEAHVWIASSPFKNMYPGYTVVEEKDPSDYIQEDPVEP